MKLNKNVDPDKYGYNGYGTGFDAHSQFSLPDCSWGENVVIFGADTSSFVHVDGKEKYFSSKRMSKLRIRWYHCYSKS